MATVTERPRKDGGMSYLIRSSCGYSTAGQQNVQSKTWSPDPGMRPRQIQKELERQKILFDAECAAGGVSGNVKFQTIAEQWFKEYARVNLRSRTLDRLHQHEPPYICCARAFAA